MTDTVLSLPAETAGGYETTRFNALRHGVLSRYTVLPWEDEAEYQALIEAMATEHAPQGPTEEHLVEELAGILWRKRRLRMAECASYHRGLEDATSSFGGTAQAALVLLGSGDNEKNTAEAIRATPQDTENDRKDLEQDEAKTKKALKILRDGKPEAYERALVALQEDTRDWWHNQLTWEPDDYEENDEPYTPDAAGLLRFLETEVCPWHENRRIELENRPLIRDQAIGESLNPNKLERLARYEVHLDRKLERTLAMLIRLQDLRRGSLES